MKQIKVEVNGIKYFPENTSSTFDKPFDEPGVNYRALVNDKLRDLNTFHEGTDEEIKEGEDRFLCVASGYANSDRFIRAGRVQEVLKGRAYYAGKKRLPLYLKLYNGVSWEEIYRSLLKHEQFIVARKKFRS